MSFRISVIKKNQIITWSLIIMLLVAGYLNYTNDPRRAYDIEVTGTIDDNLGDAVFVDGNNLVTDTDSLVTDVSSKDLVQTSDEFFSKSRIERNNIYAEQIETYEKIISDSNSSENQKEKASNEIKNINDEKNAISISENLIKLKGIEDVVILVNNESVNVIILEEEVTDSKIAQIQNIIQNELGSKVENIHINSIN